MTANKKTTAKASKSPAPTTKEPKTAKPAAKPANTKTAPLARKEAAAASAIVAAVARAAAPAMTQAPAAVAVSEVAASALTTTIAAKIDIGFGNTLYLRGEGPGLSWDQGLLMENKGSDLWEVQLGESARPFVFKFLVNDLTWSAGADYSLPAGVSGTFTPEF